MRRFILPLLSLATPALAATFPIVNDTYLDNFYINQNGVVIDNAHTNYGHNAAVKGTSNNGTGSDYPGVNSLTHAILALPSTPTFLNALGAGPLAAGSVTVTYYARNPSLATNDASKNPSAIKDYADGKTYRQLEIHPLLQPFVAGTGGSGADTRAGMLNVSTGQYGADWYAATATTSWSTPGGSFDAAFASSGLVNSATKQFSPVSFDITGLLNSTTTRAEILANGLLIRTTDEGAYTGNEFASLISYDSALNGGSFANYAPFVSVVPEPAALAVAGMAVGGLLRRRRTA